MTQTPQPPRDWQKESEHLNWLVSKATEGMKAEKDRADAAEAQNEAWERKWRKTDYARHSAEDREQQLKEAVQTALQLHDMGESSDVYPLLKVILATLYPDTPAPTNEEE